MWDALFLALNLAVVPAWLLLLFWPRAQLTRRLVHSALYPIGLGLAYAAALGAAMFFGQSDPNAGFSLSGVSALFDHPNGVLVGWSHYLVFDLFVGAWIGRDALKRDVGPVLRIPSQLGSYVFGPVGLLIYLIGRWGTGKGGFQLDTE